MAVLLVFLVPVAGLSCGSNCVDHIKATGVYFLATAAGFGTERSGEVEPPAVG